MQLSALEEEVLEKAAGDCGTTYSQHNWVSRAVFLEAVNHLIDLCLLEKQPSGFLSSILNEEFQTYRKIR